MGFLINFILYSFPFLIPLSYGFMNLSKLILSFMKKTHLVDREKVHLGFCVQKKKTNVKLLQWLFLCFMLKDSFKSILVVFFQGKDGCDLKASTNHGMLDGNTHDGNEDVLVNDGALAVVDCYCKPELLCKWRC